MSRRSSIFCFLLLLIFLPTVLFGCTQSASDSADSVGSVFTADHSAADLSHADLSDTESSSSDSRNSDSSVPQDLDPADPSRPSGSASNPADLSLPSSVFPSVSGPATAEDALKGTSFSWAIQPELEFDDLLVLRNADQPGYFAVSPYIAYLDHGYLGLLDQNGQTVLDSNFTDLAYSRRLGGLIGLMRGSTVYTRLSNKLVPENEVEYSPAVLTASTPFRWDADTQVILNSDDDSLYTDAAPVAVQDPETGLYGIGSGKGLSCDFLYSDLGYSGLSERFFMKDASGWHLIDASGTDVLKGRVLEERLQRRYRFDAAGTLSVDYAAAAPYPCSEGIFVLQEKEGLWALYSSEGVQLSPAVFEALTPVCFGKVWACLNDRWGLIDLTR